MNSLPLRLRAFTSEAHARLERDLDLLAPPLDRQRFVELLARFWGFHAVWEPAVRRHAALLEVMAERFRLDLIAADLQALGMSPQAVERLPLCAEAEDLTDTIERTLGSLYVLEGSTLGGRIISRALEGASWVPEGGLRYFDPYGPRTGLMWRGVQDQLKAASTPVADPLVENGALSTFAMLQAWLVPRPR